VKATLEIPDPVFRRAKARAAERGIPLRQFVTEAVEEKLGAGTTPVARPWLKCVGKLRHLQGDLRRIDRVIEQEFERIEPSTARRRTSPN
jgi:hypothetical protein